MNDLEMVYDYADKLNIDVYNRRLSDTKLAICLCTNDYKVIALR